MEKVGSFDNDSNKGTPFEKVFRGIRRALYEGRFVPGQRLIAPDLMREFDVGRGTIREVLQRLASTGVVSIMPNKGAVVRRFSRSEVAELLDLVEVLMGLAARKAANSVEDLNLRCGLKARFEELIKINPEREFNRFVTAREEYYRFLLTMAGSHELQRVFPSIQVHIMRLQLRTFDRAADSADASDYSDLTNSVLSANLERAEAAGRLHVQRTIGRVFVLPDRAFEAD